MLPLSDLVKERILTRKSTPQGLHILQGVTLFAGVLPYPVQDDEGTVTVSGVLSHPEDLFNDSLATLVGVGVYIEHPQSGFTYDLKDAVGIVLSAEPKQNYLNNDGAIASIQGDVNYALLKVGIWDNTALETINNGKKELSAGYDAALIVEAGIWYGTPYSYRKKNITYNHLAIVDTGTARNGAYSRLIDKQSGEYTNICEIDTKIVDSLSLNIIKDSGDNDDNFIPIEQIIGGVPMKHLAIGKNVISVEDTSVNILTEFIDTATATENKLKGIEAEKLKLGQEVESLKTKIKDSEDTLAKLQSVPANSSLPIEELKKAMKEYRDLTKGKTKEEQIKMRRGWHSIKAVELAYYKKRILQNFEEYKRLGTVSSEPIFDSPKEITREDIKNLDVLKKGLLHEEVEEQKRKYKEELEKQPWYIEQQKQKKEWQEQKKKAKKTMGKKTSPQAKTKKILPKNKEINMMQEIIERENIDIKTKEGQQKLLKILQDMAKK